ncbi:MAG: hypothetical protein HQM06_10065 [Magnetococcales bacterium]|nr:hypothetical protein [Magnetococcales bacterium]
MITSTDPSHMSQEQRLDEIAGILANGVLRLRLKTVQQHENRENFSLDNGCRMRPDGTPKPIDFEREKP